MKPSFRVNRVWQIGYPLAVYFIVYNLAYKLFCVIFSKIGSPLFWLGISAAITIPLIYGMYKKLPTIKCEKRFQSETIFKELALVALIVAIGIGLNICITQLSLVGESAGFEKANQTLYSGGLFARIFSTCICIPILEELLYRGVICGQLGLWYNNVIAALVSAFLFGMMHFNMVQFIYAFCMGLVLGYIFLRTKKLWVVMLAHGLTNLVVVLYHI